MSLTFNTKTFSADAFGQNAVGYVGPAKTSSMKDDLTLRRTAPKPTANFSGVSRGLAKLVRSHTLTNALNPVWDSISNVDVSLPVGIAAADVDAICADLSALVASTAFKDHLKKQLINF